MVAEYAIGQLLQVTEYLPCSLRQTIQRLPPAVQREVEEIRLRAGRPLAVCTSKEEMATETMVHVEDLELALEIASQASAYTVLNQVRNGYVSLKGGHRLGICGTGVIKNGEVTHLQKISSLSFRVAREFPGMAEPLLKKLQEMGGLQNTLILSPPGFGKTTLLRDMVRSISNGQGIPPCRVSVADERGELAAMFGGEPQMNIGVRTDVMDGCPKADAILLLLRGMTPQVIALDEITAPKDIEAMEMAVGCGVVLLATAHAEKPRDFMQRPLYRRILEEKIFTRLVWIEKENGKRRYTVSKSGGGGEG